MAQKILDHLRSSLQRSLYIMCHIPVFCWISATALQSLLTETHKGELPKTVTEMYTHFLIMQTKMKHQKDYQEGEIDKDEIMNLGKLDFEQLQEGNIIFNEDDLKSHYSGVCTEIIRKEYGLHKQEFYSFIHLSVQEFLAALYVLETFMDGGENLFHRCQTCVSVASLTEDFHIIPLIKDAVDMALVSDYGQWDLFLRFLFGLSRDKNQKLLQKAFGFERGHLQSNKQTIKYIHEKIRKLSSTDKSINLFHCLNELGDQSLVEQVQKYQSSGDVKKISPAHWSALAFLLLVSHDELNVFDLKKYHRSDEVLERLLPVLKASKTALLSECNLTDRCCLFISSIFNLKSSGLEELDLSRNQLLDSGINLLCDGLKSPICKLQRLRGQKLYQCFSLSITFLQAEWLDIIYYGACELTLDTNTAHRNLKLSEDNRKVTLVSEEQPYPDHPERFDVWPQLLCRTGLTGRCYWEVEWRGRSLYIMSKDVNDGGTLKSRRPCTSKSEDEIVPVPEPLHISDYQQILQSNLHDKFMCAQEGWMQKKDEQRLDDIYINLWITAGADTHINTQHEVRQIEKKWGKPAEAEKTIKPSDMFKHPSGRYRPIRTVLTNGIAGIGKTFLVRKFVLDWAEKKTNHDVHLIFAFTFRQLNLLKGKTLCLAELIHEYIWEMRDIKRETLNHIFTTLHSSGNTNYDKSKFKLLFVLDGLDESRLQLDFSTDQYDQAVISEVTESTSVDVLLTKPHQGETASLRSPLDNHTTCSSQSDPS
ncbi:hypothetical protein L3Q82_020125 [Scortum barcoo]|uniref:Uncharacterized protein n=1 Tax=Scortum barcoo TaxID=214431 RepID=A0ACB8VB19_9TELE|nr:hypothetical protein L3Q82_020125 [Scortum barcoo]